MRFFLILYLCYCSIFTLCAQQTFNLKNYSKSDGLSDNYIFDIVEDSRGVIWFPTTYGINTFNGTDFYSYTKENSPSAHLIRNDFVCAHAHTDERLFFAGFNGSIMYYDHGTGDFHDVSLNYISMYEYPLFRKFYQADSSDLYVLSADGVYRYSPFAHKFLKAFREVHFLNHSDVLSMHIDTHKNFWFGTNTQGLVWLSADSVQKILIDLEPYSVTENPRIHAILPISDTLLYVGTTNGFYAVTYHEFGDFSVEQKFPELSAVFISALEKDLQGNVWIGTSYSGVWVYTKNGELIRLQQHQTSNIPIAAVDKILCDSEGRVWIATYGDGLFLYNPVYNGIQHTDVQSGLGSNIVSAIQSDVFGNIWVGTDGGGITIFNSKSQPIRVLNQKTGLSSNSIMKMIHDGETMWVASWQGGIMGISMKDYTVRVYSEKNTQLLHDAIKAFCFKNSDTILLGTHQHGLHLFSLPYENIHFIDSIDYGAYFPPQQNFINDMIYDSDSVLWVATIRNLYIVEHNEVTQILENDVHEHPHFPLFVHSLHETHSHEMLVGTNKGAFIIHKKTKNIQNASEIIPELANVEVFSVFADVSNNFWFASAHGLFVYKAQSQTYKKIVVSKTSSHLFYIPRAVFQDSNGKMYFGTNEGLFSFYEHEILQRHTIVDMFFSDFYVSHQKVVPGSDLLPKHISLLQGIELSAEQNVWGIAFESVCFNSPEAVEYAYFLKGFNDSWVPIGKTRELTFTNIPPGDYTLYVKAWQFNPEHAIVQSLTITITPPWWKTPWFLLLALLTVFALLYGLYYLRLYSLQKQKRVLEKEVFAQTKTLKQQKQQIEVQNSELKFVSKQLQDSNQELSEQKEELEDLTKQLQEESLELSELNKSLKQLNETNNQLFSLITHDVKNSFYSIQGLSEMLRNDFESMSTSQKQRIISLISQATINTSDLLENLLFWSKGQSTTIECRPDYFEVVEIIQDVIESYQHVAQEKNIITHFKNTKHVRMYADREMITTVLRNIYNNALKYTDKGGVVVISLKEKNDFVEVKIKDSGIGIEADILEGLMDVEKKSMKKQHTLHGSGLGLLVSKQFVEKNKGEIHIESSPNKGTVFYIRVPIKPQHVDNSTIATVYEGERMPIKEHAYRIAIVDDNPAILRLFRDFLEQDFMCVLFTSAREFLETLQHETFHMVVSDILMPEIDGFLLCNTIKNKKKTSHIPVILISSIHDDNIKRQAYESNADAFLQKPVSKPVLLALIHKIFLQNEQKENKISLEHIHTDAQNSDTFMMRFDELLKQNIANSEFSVEDMAEYMNMSRTQLFRKVKQAYAISPKDYFIKMRMNAAAELLQYNDSRIIEIAYAIGFSDPSYFTRCFVKYYGVTPSDYRDSLLRR